MKNQKMKNRILAATLVFVMVAATAFTQPHQAKAEGTTTEPEATNITFDTARDLRFNSSIAEELSYSDTKRYYKFSVSEASALNLAFSRGGDGDININVYDKLKTSVFHAYNYFDYDFSLNNIYLTGGDYYLGIESTRSFSMLASIDSLSESFAETQDSDNNTVNNASAISIGTQYKGVLAQNDDKDYYKFTLSDASKVTINITNSTTDTLKYTIYDSSVNSSYTNTVRSGDNADETITLAPDNYYLAITKGEDNPNGSYNLLLTSVIFIEPQETPAPQRTPVPQRTPAPQRTNVKAPTLSVAKTTEPQIQQNPQKTTLKAPTLLSVKNKGSKQITVKWKRVSGISGYQLQYWTKKSFKNGVKKKNIYASKTSAKYSGLKKRKTYYVRIRAYVIVNGYTKYSGWSKVRKVKIRK